MWTGGENAYVDASSEPIILVENLLICIEANGSGARAGKLRKEGDDDNPAMDGQAKRTISQIVFRWVFYVCGMIILSVGVVLNTKSLMGVSPIISVPYVISIIGGFNFGDAAMAAYVVIALAGMPTNA